MIYLKKLFYSSLVLATLVGVSLAETDTDFLDQFRKRVTMATYGNGLRAVLVERPNIPTVSFAVFIRTGGIDDEWGQSGMAHMFEHMLFKGTQSIGTTNYFREAKLLKKINKAALALDSEKDKGPKADPEKIKTRQKDLLTLQKEHEKYIIKEEFWKIYEQAGARGLNAGTGFDYTNYTVSLPANQLKLWMMMESARIKKPVLREFYKERDVVLEERRMRVDNSPRGKLWENFLATAFVAHPYGRPILGWETEISRVTVGGAKKFFKKHYDISRLVIAIVGGINAKDVEAMIETHFGDIPSNPTYVPTKKPIEPPQNGERRLEVEFDAEPSLLIGYHRPSFQHPDNAALEVLSDVLGTGRTSRFYKTIIEKKRIATSAWAGSSTPGERDPCLFVLGGTPRAPHTAQDLEEALYKEVDRIKKEGPTENELKKVKKFALEYIIRTLSSNNGLARNLGYYEAIAGDWAYLLKIIEDIQNVTAEDVKRVANQYLVKTNRTVGTLVKKP